MNKLYKKDVLIRAMRKTAGADAKISKDEGGFYGAVGAKKTVGPVTAKSTLKRYLNPGSTNVSGSISGNKTVGNLKVKGSATGSVTSGGSPTGGFNVSAVHKQSPTRTTSGNISGRSGRGLKGNLTTTKNFGGGNRVSGIAGVSKKGLTLGGNFRKQVTNRFNVGGSASLTTPFGKAVPSKSNFGLSAGGRNFGLKLNRQRDYGNDKNNRFTVTPTFNKQF